MSLRDAVNQVPAKPIIAVVAVVTVVAALWHGLTLRGVCTHRAALTDKVQNWAQEALKSGDGEVRLVDATPFAWDEVRIAHPTLITQPTGGQTPRNVNCPFGWYWSDDKRHQMAARGELTLLGFIKDQRLIEIVEIDRKLADIPSGKYSRENAVFNAQGSVTLAPVVK